MVPVFFTADDGSVYVQTDRESVKVRNLQRNPGVAVAIFDAEEAVIIRGTGQIVDHEQFVRRTSEHVRKYRLRLDASGRDTLGIPLFDPQIRCVVEVTPRRVIFW